MRRQGDSLPCPRSLQTAPATWHLPPAQAPGVGCNLQHRIVGKMQPGRGSAGDGAAVEQVVPALRKQRLPVCLPVDQPSGHFVYLASLVADDVLHHSLPFTSWRLAQSAANCAVLTASVRE
jgi:hypothetical protein